MSQRGRRYSLIAIVALGGGCLLGGFLGGGLRADAHPAEDELRTFGRVLALIEDNYVGDADSPEIVKHAILGMLRKLDPHSSYLDRDSFTEMRDEQRGKFSGLGIQISKRGPSKPLTIIAPIDDTPADRAGLQAGDIIYQIEGERTIDMTVQEAVRRLKGDRGTQVSITIKRPGLDETFDVKLTRDDIPINSLRVALMLDERTGFVRLSNFTSTTADELDAAIAKLGEQGMEQLILDLRGNPGGLLDQAVQVSERFIPAGEKIVFTRGRVPGADQDYVARAGVERVRFPLVVLVDHASASASEIVSGAIQDHDRGLVVGETTFGKGLVQRVIPLRDGGALAVTTAKYYTPSGRLIQRDYSDLDDYYFGDDVTVVTEGDEVEVGGEEVPLLERDVFYTTSGREVYGGGGITPDYIVKARRTSKLFARIRRENLLFDFAVRYAAQHDDLEPGFEATDELMSEFRRFLRSRDFSFTNEEFDKARENLALTLRAQVSRVKWDNVEEARVLAEGDPLVIKALAVFGEASRLAENGSGRSREREPERVGLRHAGS